MIDYKIVARVNPRKPSDPVKYYAAPSTRELIDTQKLCELASKHTTISVGEILNVFDNLMSTIPELLLNGCSVKLGELGTMRVTFGSQGADSSEDFKADLIKEPKVIFTASKKLREQIRREAHFNKSGAAAPSTDASEDEDEL